MNEIIKLRYSEDLVRESVRAFVGRTLVKAMGRRGWIVIVGVVIWGAYCWATGERGVMTWLALALPVIVGLLGAWIYAVHYRNSLRKFRAMKEPEATLSCGEEDFTMESSLAKVTLKWAAVVEVWRFPRFWLILFSRSQFATLPLADLDAETQALITRKTTDAVGWEADSGGKRGFVREGKEKEGVG